MKDKYYQETLEKWGNTEAFQQCQGKTGKYRKSDWDIIHAEANTINANLAELIDKSYTDENVQQLVKDWQNHITKYFYICTNDILRGLGEMYIADERFKKYYDDIKPGLSQFFSDAVKHFCENNE